MVIKDLYKVSSQIKKEFDEAQLRMHYFIANELKQFTKNNHGRPKELYIEFIEHNAINLCVLMLGEIILQSKRPELNVLGQFYQKLTIETDQAMKAFKTSMGEK